MRDPVFEYLRSKSVGLNYLPLFVKSEVVVSLSRVEVDRGC